MEKPTRAATGRDSDKYIVRFPPGMRDQIAADAKRNNRTMNAEIVDRLQGGSSANSGVTDALAAYAISLEREIEELRIQKSSLGLQLQTAIVYLKGGSTAKDKKVSVAIEEWEVAIDNAVLDLDEQGGIVEGKSNLIQEIRAKISDAIKKKN
ncbi:Arc family DNA-binding protein [Duganella sp. BJB488]|uniref:Arc family DNA-binding protein n=1 Tax=unclassified Duganella TaxID=2636909 RepID=UPI000E34D488|nr:MULTISPECIES: Arc family DNA-binding protein [unclassified Duganella]RFP23174.1 Arc family DNA-binding protein [Duganella sp. BJB489]RFP24750.1 Arc family DNA-binding protein [Duganella sp. BJB488]RFP34172.1 Arc family DNA-binding protein [Duganella sp. BJB480]